MKKNPAKSSKATVASTPKADAPTSSSAPAPAVKPAAKTAEKPAKPEKPAGAAAKARREAAVVDTSSWKYKEGAVSKRASSVEVAQKLREIPLGQHVVLPIDQRQIVSGAAKAHGVKISTRTNGDGTFSVSRTE